MNALKPACELQHQTLDLILKDCSSKIRAKYHIDFVEENYLVIFVNVL